MVSETFGREFRRSRETRAEQEYATTLLIAKHARSPHGTQFQAFTFVSVHRSMRTSSGEGSAAAESDTIL